jgi:hypothetical protein
MVFPVFFGDRQIVDAGKPAAHQALLVEFPILVAIGPKPMPAIVTPFIGEPYGDPVILVGPNLLDQAVVQLPRPFTREKGLDLRTAANKLRTVPP